MEMRSATFARMPAFAPRIETCWQLLGPSLRPLVCAIYRTDIGLEVRVQYGDRSRLYTRRAAELLSARKAAARLRDALNAKGVFQESYLLP
jgi:hypothetical protein